MDSHTLTRAAQPVPFGRRRPAPQHAGAWVPAAPARCHLWYVIGATGVPWPALAVHAGVSVQSVRHLLFGRLGRSVRRISPTAARRLLALTVPDVLSLRYRRVPAEPTIRRLALLRRWGCDTSAFEAHLGPDARSCTQLIELLVLAECLQRPWPVMPVSREAGGVVVEASWDVDVLAVGA